MFRTIFVVGRITAQGLFVKELPDGRVVISLGDRTLAGFPVAAFSR